MARSVAIVVAAAALLGACEPPPGAEATSAAAGSATPDDGAVRAALAETVRRADSAAAAIESELRPVPLQRPAEENALRRYLNDAHVARARSLGAHPADDAEVRAMVADGRLVALEDSTRYWIVRDEDGDRTFHVVPHTRALLEELGRRFQARLAEMGLPPYRLEVTSALRTAQRQAALRRSNENAAAGVSAHEFGTTVDLAYSAFAPPREVPAGLIPDDAPDDVRPLLERVVDLALESVSARKSRELTKIFGDVLRRAQDEGLVYVTLERLQPVYHITVARALAP